MEGLEGGVLQRRNLTSHCREWLQSIEGVRKDRLEGCIIV